MASVKKIARRSFLIGSSAIAGGVAFGAYNIAKPAANPLLAEQGEGQAVFNPYVMIDQNGITLITPRGDMGQGAYGVQAILIAEELDVELDQVNISPGQPSAAYWNTAMGPETAEFLAGSHEGTAYDMAASTVNTAMKAFGVQVTGGSTTVPDGWMKLRQAGASARETLKLAAAKKSGIKIEELTTQSGAVILPDGSQMLYTELAADAAKLDAVQNVELKDRSEWRLIGKPTERIDMRPKATGAPIYGIDAEIEGMVHAAIALNPAQGGALESFDGANALSMRGVQDVIAVTGGVAVVADNSWRAMEAAKRVEAQWGKADFPDSMDEHWQALSDSFGEENINSRKTDIGDVEESLEGGEVFEAEYRAPYLAHAPLEPINAVVLVNDDSVEVWTGTQIPRNIQTNLARITGVDADRVKVNNLYMGGSFGHRLEDEVVKQCAEIAVTMKGTPVKLTYSREEDMMHDFTRPLGLARLRGRVSNGQVETMDIGVAVPNVAASQMSRQGINMGGADSQAVAGIWAEPFDVPNRRVTAYNAPQLAPISSWRSVGASMGGFFYNSALDELINEAGADPLEERLRLCNDDLTRKVLETIGEMSSWGGRSMGENRGRGLAFTQSFGVRCAEVIEVSNTAQGIKIDKVYAAAEVGTIVDPINFEAQVSGGIVWSLGHAMNCEITYTNGVADQTNFHDFEAMRLYQTPEIIVKGLENGDSVHGMGEPAVPPAPAALANAIFAATGQRLREMPFNKSIDFV